MEDQYKEENLETSITHELKVDKAREKAAPILSEFLRARRKVDDRYAEHMENMAFYEGRQYQLSRYKMSRPWVVRMRTPYASVAIDTRVSSLIASDYRGDLVPMSPDDQEAVESLNDFKNDEWERMNLNTKINESIKTSAIVREAYLHFRWVDEKIGSGQYQRDGYIEAYAIDMPASVYIDPAALSLKEARFVSILSRMPLSDLQDKYPEFKADFAKSHTAFTPEDRGEVYLSDDYSTEQDDVMTVVTHYRREKGKIKKYVVVEDILVDEKLLDGLTMFPIAQMRWKRVSASPYGLSLMDELIDLQKSINAIESAVTNTAISYSAPSYGVRKGSGVDPKQLAVAIGAPGMVISVEGDIQSAIQPLNLPKLDNAIIGVKQDYVGAIDRVAGISNPYLGSVGTTGNTAQGTKMALERARIIEADVLHNIELFIEDITQILIQYIAANYSGETVTSRNIDQTTGEATFNERNIPENIEDLQYSFFINLNAKTSYSKEREKELILELYQMQHQYKDEIKLINQLDVLASYDLSNKEMLVDRFKKLTAQTNEEKSQIIMQMVTTATQVGVPEDMVQAAIQELMENKSETPITDQVMQMMQQMAQEQSQLREETMGQFKQDLTQAGVPQQAVDAAQMQAMAGMGGPEMM